MKQKKKKSTTFKFGFLSGVIFFGILLFGFNFVFQIYKNPAALMGIHSWGQSKTLTQTWRTYKSEFQENATEIITPKYLAALAQVESSGNPLVTQKWKINWNRGFKGLYAPASSSAGLFQFTTPTFEWAKQFCVHDGKVYKEGPWHEFQSCWFNNLQTRFFPSSAIEVASGYLDTSVRKLIRNKRVSLKNKKRLASIVHLCGLKKGKRFVRNGFHLQSMRHCGSHSVYRYVRNVEKNERKLRSI